MTQRKEVCGKCRHWNPAEDGIRKGLTGECRRDTPRLSLQSGASRAGIFPTMPATEWCGRFDYRDGEAPMTIPC